jgi:SHS2 domain-containing protein
MKKRFEFLDISTADVCFAAYGRTLEECFANAALAMFEVMVDTRQVRPRVERKVELRARDLPGLLFEWLNELLFYYGAENLAFSEFKVEIDQKELRLRASCRGEPIDPQRHEVRTEVKATTYHKMSIKRNEEWKAQVIVDI